MSGQNETDSLARVDREFADCGKVLAVRFNVAPQGQGVRPGDGKHSVTLMSHPGHDLPLIKSNDELHRHCHPPAHAFHNAHDIGALIPRRHEINQAHGSRFGGKLGFKSQRTTR